MSLVLLLALLAPTPEDDLAVAWLRDGKVETRTATPDALTRGVPLGSAWKLFVYAYVVDKGMEAPDYRCSTPLLKGEEYCCEPGGAVGRDRALARSCGLFFAPERLKIDPDAWRSYWKDRSSQPALWVNDLRKLKPETALDAPEVLRALEAVPTSSRRAAERALLPVVVETPGVVAHLGGLVRVKTFTWAHPKRAGASIGGGAGWLVDGTPLWFSASGSSRQVLQREAARLSSWLPSPRGPSDTEACVTIDYFARYPIRGVDHLPGGGAAPLGPLRGEPRVRFENGNALTFSSEGELQLTDDGGTPRIRGRLGLTEYVARVLDREADPGATEAARALALVARTWLFRNAPFEGGCFKVADSTRMQRVSPSRATPPARLAALFADGLVVQGADVRYERDGHEGDVLVWTTAKARASQGDRFDDILSGAFPHSTLAAESGEAECRHLPAVEAWFARAAEQWERQLSGEPGFERPEQALAVCALDQGNPYSDRERMRVYVRGLTSAESRVTLAHEYVHLAFRFHPNGYDEGYVERLARKLAEE